MKLAIVLFAIFALGACGRMRVKKSDVPSNFADMVKAYGYPVESYDVQTEDGYILTLFRIPRGRQNSDEEKSSEENSERKGIASREEESKEAVLLMHGLMTNSECFIYGGPSESLALKLVDEGYDVFLGNARGSIYGQRHTTLNPQKDEAFWRFSWDEIGTKDLPALIVKALSIGGKDKLSLLGHNEGTTSFYVLASEKPEIKDKIERHISLGPMVFLKYSNNEILHTAEQHIKPRSWLIKNLGSSTFAPSEELILVSKENCKKELSEDSICENVYFLFNGYNSAHLNKTTLNQLLSRVPSTASAREVLHWLQLKVTGRFETYSEDLKGREYDLSKIKIPVALFYTSEDGLSTTLDVDRLAKELPNVYMESNMKDLDNNLDLLFSENVSTVTEKVVVALQMDIKRFIQ